MAIAIARPVSVEDAAPELKSWTVDEYLRLFETGFLPSEGASFELLQGQVIRKLGQSQFHIASLRLVAEALRLVFGRGYDVSQQLPLHLSEVDRPEPDVTVLKGTARDFQDRAPLSSEVMLVVEVADSRLDTARGAKVEIYAKNGIQEYWIVDLRRRVLEVRQGPIAETGEWTNTHIYSESDSVIAAAANGTPIPVTDLLPQVTPEP